MRLLHTEALELHSFLSNEAPEYVILSHTWGDEEVAFQDFTYDTFRTRKGFSKIQRSCEQAIRDGYEYIWIDTCCIDKSSSAELQEAINSMWDWYRNAHICYAYLSDVPDAAGPDLQLTLEESRWFTRGWTLQELLAPDCVEFYAANWELLGTKHEHLAVISEITSIDGPLLHSFQPDATTAADIMSWAAHREVSREEDIAYSLLGLFDLQMPLLYGEGGRKAFFRLQELIVQRRLDHTIFLWTWCFKKDMSPILADNPSKFCREPGLCCAEVLGRASTRGSGYPASMAYYDLVRTCSSLESRNPELDKYSDHRGEFRVCNNVIQGSFRMYKVDRTRLGQSQRALPGIQMEDDIWYASLDLISPQQKERSGLLCIVLKEQLAISGRFKRAQAEIEFIDLDATFLVDYGYKTVFIHQEPWSYYPERYLSVGHNSRYTEFFIEVKPTPITLACWHSTEVARPTRDLGWYHTYHDGTLGRDGNLAILLVYKTELRCFQFAFVVSMGVGLKSNGRFHPFCKLRSIPEAELERIQNFGCCLSKDLLNFGACPVEDHSSDRLTFRISSDESIIVALRRHASDLAFRKRFDTVWFGHLEFRIQRQNRTIPNPPVENCSWESAAWWEGACDRTYGSRFSLGGLDIAAPKLDDWKGELV